jgi:hypothetical protein
MRFLLLFFALLLSLAACRSPRQFTESGDYDAAIDLCIRKLQGKSKKKVEYVQGLELAFQKAQARDLNLIASFKHANRPENWEKINTLHRAIRSRQRRIAPLLPLRAKNGYRAKFDFIEIDRMEEESRGKAAEHLYDTAGEMLRRAEGGDKLAARRAHALLLDIEKRYYKNYRDKAALLERALDLGTSYVLFEVKNQSGQLLPRAFDESLRRIGRKELDSDWKAFYFEAEPGVQYDYKAVFKVRQVDLSPERVHERLYTDEQEIEDGWDYVLDKKGNVRKDSLGNDMKKPRKVVVRAQVIEVFQSKAARLSGQLEIYDDVRKQFLDHEDLNAEILFENYASTYTGDARALSADTRQRIGNRPLPFPDDADMLLQAADRIKPSLRDALRRSRAIL